MIERPEADKSNLKAIPKRERSLFFSSKMDTQHRSAILSVGQSSYL